MTPGDRGHEHQRLVDATRAGDNTAFQALVAGVRTGRGTESAEGRTRDKDRSRAGVYEHVAGVPADRLVPDGVDWLLGRLGP